MGELTAGLCDVAVVSRRRGLGRIDARSFAAQEPDKVPFDFSRRWYETDMTKLESDAGLKQFRGLLMQYHGSTGASARKSS